MPFLYGSCIRSFPPVYPGARFVPLIPNVVSADHCFLSERLQLVTRSACDFFGPRGGGSAALRTRSPVGRRSESLGLHQVSWSTSGAEFSRFCLD